MTKIEITKECDQKHGNHHIFYKTDSVSHYGTPNENMLISISALGIPEAFEHLQFYYV